MIDNDEKNSKTGIQVISRAVAILRVLRGSKSGMSLGQIATRVDLPRSTVQRISGALVAEGFLIGAPEGRGLRLGPELISFSGATQYSIVEHCRLFLTELTQKTGETSDLSVMRGVGMTFLDQVPGTHRLTTLSKVDEVFPLTTTANGRACLALMPCDDAEILIRSEWARNEINGDINAFFVKLDQIKNAGFAYDLDEHSSGISAIGFGFRDWAGALHAISVPIPTTRFSEMRQNVETALLTTKRDVAKLFE